MTIPEAPAVATTTTTTQIDQNEILKLLLAGGIGLAVGYFLGGRDSDQQVVIIEGRRYRLEE